jgi:hypothetical protein
MACGCTEVSRSGLVAQPTPSGQPALPAREAAAPKAAHRVEVAQREMKLAVQEVARATTPSALDRQLGKARSALAAARQAKAPKAEVQRLKSQLRDIERTAKDKTSAMVYNQARDAATAAAAGNLVQAALFRHRAQSAIPPSAAHSPKPSPGGDEKASSEIASQWGAVYERQSGNEIVCVTLGTLTYGFDTVAERLVYVTGKTDTPAMRDRGRQQGSPKPSQEGDEKGHVIATSLGGGMDINLIPQARDVNRGKGSRWSAIERELAKRPGSAIAIHLVYSDESQRPASFEFGHESDSGFQVEQIDNPKSP